MTATTQSRMNLGLALAIPTAGLAYLTASGTLSPNRVTLAAVVALGVLWLTATAVVNTVSPRAFVPALVPAQYVAKDPLPRASRPGFRGSIDVSRPVAPWTWRSIALAPLEMLALAWSVPLLVLAVMVPIGLALAGALWVGRLILHS